MRSSRPTALGTIPYLAEQKHEALGACRTEVFAT